MTNTNEEHPDLGIIDKVFRGIVALCRIITGVALVAMTVLLGYQVFGRYVLNDTPTWVDPTSLLLVILIAFLGAGIGVYENTHLAVVVVRNMASKRVRTGLVVLTDAIMAFFGGVMLWYGAQLTMFKWGTQIPDDRLARRAALAASHDLWRHGSCVFTRAFAPAFSWARLPRR